MFAKQHARCWQAKPGSAVQSEQQRSPHRPLPTVLGQHHLLRLPTRQLPATSLAIHRLVFFSQSLTCPKHSYTLPGLQQSQPGPCPAPSRASNTSTTTKPRSLRLILSLCTAASRGHVIILPHLRCPLLCLGGECRGRGPGQHQLCKTFPIPPCSLSSLLLPV